MIGTLNACIKQPTIENNPASNPRLSSECNTAAICNPIFH